MKHQDLATVAKATSVPAMFMFISPSPNTCTFQKQLLLLIHLLPYFDPIQTFEVYFCWKLESVLMYVPCKLGI
jgi:hypothetical protein